MLPNFLGLFGKKDLGSYVGVDVGASSIKLIELELTEGKPRLLNAAFSPSPASAIKNNAVVRAENVGAVLKSLIDANGVSAKNVVVAVPGPSVFTKKITVTAPSIKDLENNIQYEAANYIPHSVDAVSVDFQVLSQAENGSMEALLVAVKEDIVTSFTESIEHASLNPAVVDVDYFALANTFELCYPEERENTVALINIGARYSSVLIVENGSLLFSGDVPVGGRLFTDALCEALELKAAEAEAAKCGELPEGINQAVYDETISKTMDHVTSELQRQLGFFWNAASTENPIKKIFFSGGGAELKGLREKLSDKTKVDCVPLDPFKGINCGSEFEQDYLNELRPLVAVCVGLATRTMGDKVHAGE